jgi:DNA polymerase-3 subunit gamma/tau
MAYIVLARRWRPQQFQEIIGQEHVSQTLINAVDNNRIAHSYIFSGPRGVGKTTAARILAKALNCEKGPTANPCNECSACESITKGTSLDVLEIDGASNRGIDEIRNLRENIRFTPSQGKYRIYIIDEVHMLTKEAFNALLKTLEEPPEHAIFIFATTEIHRVPLTILSRCQRFDFKRIQTRTIINHLQHICKNEKIEIEDDALLQIAKKADGSMRDSQSILDQIISYSGNNIKADDVADALGIISQEIFFNFTENIRNGNLKELIDLCQNVNVQGYDLGEFLSGFEEHFRNLLLTKTLGDTKRLDIPDHFAESFLKESQKFTETDLLAYLQQIGELQNSLKWASHPHIKFELAILKMAKLPSTLDIEKLLEKLGTLKKKTDATKENKSERSGLKSEHTFDLKSLKTYWPHLVTKFKESKVNLAHALELGEPKELIDSVLTVQYDTTDSFHTTWLNKHKKLVEEEINRQFSTHIRIKTAISQNQNPKQKKAKKSVDKQSIKKILEEDPLLNKLVDDLGLELT